MMYHHLHHLRIVSGSDVSWASFFATDIFINAAFASFYLSSSSILRRFKTSEDVKTSPAFAWTRFRFLLELATASLVACDIGGAMVLMIALLSSFLGVLTTDSSWLDGTGWGSLEAKTWSCTFFESLLALGLTDQIPESLKPPNR